MLCIYRDQPTYIALQDATLSSVNYKIARLLEIILNIKVDWIY
jgi:hypothetical protein